MKLIARLHDKDIFGFLRNCHTLFQVTVSFCIPINNEWEFLLPHSSVHLTHRLVESLGSLLTSVSSWLSTSSLKWLSSSQLGKWNICVSSKAQWIWLKITDMRPGIILHLLCNLPGIFFKSLIYFDLLFF